MQSSTIGKKLFAIDTPGRGKISFSNRASLGIINHTPGQAHAQEWVSKTKWTPWFSVVVAVVVCFVRVLFWYFLVFQSVLIFILLFLGWMGLS